jgi:hypothetical protein
MWVFDSLPLLILKGKNERKIIKNTFKHQLESHPLENNFLLNELEEFFEFGLLNLHMLLEPTRI